MKIHQYASHRKVYCLMNVNETLLLCIACLQNKDFHNTCYREEGEIYSALHLCTSVCVCRTNRLLYTKIRYRSLDVPILRENIINRPAESADVCQPIYESSKSVRSKAITVSCRKITLPSASIISANDTHVQADELFSRC